MRMRGLEPPRGFPHTDLNRARLPNPPHPRAADIGSPRGLSARFRVSTHTMADLPRVAALLLACRAHRRRGRSGTARTGAWAARAGARRPRRTRRWRTRSRPGHWAFAATRPAELSLTAPASVRHLRTLAAAQRSIEADLERVVPGATVRRRYQVVANALAVVLPAYEVDRLRALPGVSRIYPSVRYPAALDRSVHQSARSRLGPLARRQHRRRPQDRDHRRRHRPVAPVLRAERLRDARRLPQGQTAFTTAKVIVARAFLPPAPGGSTPRSRSTRSTRSHATHVSGIAAGNTTQADGDARASASPASRRARTSGTTRC